MTEAEIKLKIFRFIDNQPGNILTEIYDLLKSKYMNTKKEEKNYISDIESQYQQMSKDTVREKEALEWIEGTIDNDKS